MEALKQLTVQRQMLKKNYPNLVEYEARRMFKHFYDPEPMPDSDKIVEDVQLK
ncbi:hypothetical protein QS257_01835 [Terrilactibacillus sp. S3-3]|nr:hypothetical protein QS257_01835 [Terrilactibacillus sp. S3-3]